MGVRILSVAGLRLSVGKSFAFEPVDVLPLGPIGSVELRPVSPIGDRVLALVDPVTGKAMTSAHYPVLVLVHATLLAMDPFSGVLLTGPKGLTFPLHFDPSGKRLPITVAGSSCFGLDQGKLVAGWFSELLHADCRVVWLPPMGQRLATAPFASVPLTFADDAPFHFMSTASHQHVCQRAEYEVDARRWRCTVMLDGLKPYQEDRILRMTVPRRGITFIVRALNPRCVRVNVNPVHGLITSDVLSVLAGYRRDPLGTGDRRIMLGVKGHAVTRDPFPLLRVGDEVRVTYWRRRS